MGLLQFFVLLEFPNLLKFGVQAKKQPWDCRTEVSLKMPFLRQNPAAHRLEKLLTCGRAKIWVRFVVFSKMAFRLRCGGFWAFLGLFVSTPFSGIFSWTSSHLPLFVLVFFVSFEWGASFGVVSSPDVDSFCCSPLLSSCHDCSDVAAALLPCESM